jgi:hypothetical protein
MKSLVFFVISKGSKRTFQLERKVPTSYDFVLGYEIEMRYGQRSTRRLVSFQLACCATLLVVYLGITYRLDLFAKYKFFTPGGHRSLHSLQRLLGEDSQLTNQLATPPVTVSNEEAAYNLCMQRFWRRIKSMTPEGNVTDQFHYPDLKTQHQKNYGAITKKTRLLNSIRIPKAGSSALSVTARAIAGCQPDGYPCCKFPGHPEGSCPRKDLNCPLVTGCTGHNPDFRGDEAVITSLRNPVKRSVSAFFYTPPHTSVKQGERHTWDKLVENIQSPRYRNVLTKMLNGARAYDIFDESKHTVPNAKEKLCSMTWFGLSEMPITSHIMLYEMPDFRQLKPNPVVFGLSARETIAREEKTDGLRVNGDLEYNYFLSTTFVINNGTSLVLDHNQRDTEVFHFAERLFCGKLFSIPGLVDEMKEASLGSDEIKHCARLVGLGRVELLC